MKTGFQRKIAVAVMSALFLCSIPASCLASELILRADRDYWTAQEKPGYWTVNLRFNHPVFTDNVKNATKVTLDAADEPFELRAPQGDRKASGAAKDFKLVPTKPGRLAASVRVVVDQGLPDASGRLLMKREFTYQFLYGEKITVRSFATFFRSRTDKGLNLRLSAAVEQNELTAAMKVTPSVPNLTVTRLGQVKYQITGDFTYGQEYRLQIAEVPVNNGRALLEERKFDFKGPGIKQVVAVRTERSVVELKGRQLLPLTLTDVTKVRCELTRIPPYLAPQVLPNTPLEKVRHPEPEPADEGDSDSQDGVVAESPSPQAVPEIERPLSRDIGPIQSTFRKKTLQSLARTGRVFAGFLGEFTQASEAFFAPEARSNTLGYSLPLSFRSSPDKGGIWVAKLSDPDGNFKEETSRLVQITDLSVSYKLSAKNLLLWVTSLHTGQPVPGVELLLDRADGFRSFVGKTDKSGVLFLRDGDKFPSVKVDHESSGITNQPLSVSQVRWAIAATNGDACAVQLNDVRLKPHGVTQTKDVQDVPDARTGYLFTERGVYKPGETVQFKFFARTYKDDQIVSPAGEKPKLEIVGPRQEIVYSKELTLSEFGTCHDTFKLESFFPVGTYTLKATLQRNDEKDKKKDVFTMTFLVQEYKRPKHYVSLSMKSTESVSKEYIGLDKREDSLSVEVTGRYYTGGPVKHAKARWNATLVPVTNRVPGLKDHFFGNKDEKTLFLESGESMLDASGKLNISIPLDSKLLSGIYGVSVSATVLDLDGEPATEVETFNPKPRFLVGISQHPRQVKTGYAGAMKIIVSDAKGKLVQQGKIEARIMQKTSFYTRKRDEAGNINPLWEEGWTKKLSSEQRLVKGEAIFNMDFSGYGDYLVAFTYEDNTGRYTSQTLFKVGSDEYDNWRRGQSETDARTSNQIMVSMSKKEYAPGESVRIDFQTPRPVKQCLVTMERNGILDFRLVDLNGTDGKYEFKADDKYQPNVYVSVIGPAGREGYPLYASQTDTDIPTIYFGYANVTVRNQVKKLRVEIDPGQTELKGRPGEAKKLSFNVMDQSGKGVISELAVCVVDEAMLALTRFKTPELSALTNFDLPLAVFSGDLRLALVSQDLFRMFATRPLTGGDGGLEEIAATLKIRNDFRPVAYFNPAIVTDASGQAKVEFQLPDTTTAYRVYAVACDKASGFTSNQRNMVVSKEFFIEPSVPRFLIPGDRLTFPINLQNKTAEKGQASLSAEASKDLKVRLIQDAATIEPWSSAIIKADCEVIGGTQEGKLTFKGQFVGPSARYGDAIEQTLPIHSRYMPIHRVIVGDFTRTADISVDLPQILKTIKPDELNPADFQAHLSFSTADWAKMGPGLQYLLHYPYGCVEQTSSGIIPLAGLRGLIQSGTIPGIAVTQVDRFMKKGIERLLSMQLQSGGFAYWPGQKGVSWWGTVYGTFALTMANQAGYKVPENRLNAALVFLHEGLFKTREGDPFREVVWAKEFALLNLALNNKLTAAELEPFFKNYDSASIQSKALLLLAAAKVGYLPEKITEMLSELNPKPDPGRMDYRNSSFREIAVCLLAAMETGSDLEKARAWAGFLVRGLKPDGKWASTADTGWCLLALSKYYEKRERGKPGTIKLSIDYGADKPREITTSDDMTVSLTVDPRKLLEKGKIRVTADTKDLMSYTLSVTYPDLATEPSDLSRGFTLQKTIENLSGKEEIRVGDVLRVTLDIGILALEYDRGFRYEYFALEDPVPAGLVPINSELATEGAEKQRSMERYDRWRNGYYEFTPSHIEFRDDGVRVFKDRAWQGHYRYSYLARAVAAGEFWMRGSRVSLMYDPDRFGKTLGKKVKVLPAEN